MKSKLANAFAALTLTVIPFFGIVQSAKADLYLQSVDTETGIYTRDNYIVYSAIAAHRTSGRWAWVTSYSTRAGAESAALENCGVGCRVAVSASNQESLYLSFFETNNGGWGASSSDSLATSRDRAKNLCEDVNYYSCYEVFTIRNIPDPSYSWNPENLYVPNGQSDPYFNWYFDGDYL